MRDNIIVWFKKVNRTTFLEWLRRYYTFAEPKAEIKTENNEAVITWENEKRSARFTTVQLALLRVAVESLLGVTPEIHASPTLILVKIPETQQRDSHSTN